MRNMLTEGVHVFDLGAESSRPGAQPVTPELQIERLSPALEVADQFKVPLSIDTTSATVAEYCLTRGASLINDISCLSEKRLGSVVADSGARLLLMHSRGSMQQMQGFSKYPDQGYQDIVNDVKREWSEAKERAVQAGVIPSKIIFDPGLGFHKNATQSFTILQELESFHDLGHEILIGASRKSFLGSLDQAPPEQRLGGSLAVALRAVDAGARYLRVHDVGATRQALLVSKSARSSKAQKTQGVQSCTLL